ncbi:hypothetical protein IAU60_002317 [Kwoniella sp. DSM 27419]
MANTSGYTADKSLSNIFDTVSSPAIPESPAPAYTTLPDQDIDYHLEPLLDGQLGDVELETGDGFRFLVHRKVLESECVSFHIYYGFVPAWRFIQAETSTWQQNHQTSGQHRPCTSNGITTALGNLFCIPGGNPSGRPDCCSERASQPISPLLQDQAADEVPPPVPPKDTVTAPTPTTSPYSWKVPESSQALKAFLSLIYPAGAISAHPAALLDSLEITAKVLRAALGYQSNRALAISRDRLGAWMESRPFETYAMACFFRFSDLARLASTHALAIPADQWSPEFRLLAGPSGQAMLMSLQAQRLASLREILSAGIEADEHSSRCNASTQVETVWRRMITQLKNSIGPESELLELLEVDLRDVQCGDCLVLLGRSIQRCIYEAKDLPRSI